MAKGRAETARSCARLSLAAGLQMTGRPEEALPHYQHVVKIDPGRAEAWIEGGNVLVRLGRYQQAHEWLTAARKILPDDPELATLQTRVDTALTGTRARTR